MPTERIRVLGIVPARAGSKGIPGKNTRLLAGRTLVAHTARAALAARRLERVILSTESEAIAADGRAAGLEVPFLRPPELARDESPTLPVLQHALEHLEAAGDPFDAVCLLQPVDPLLEPQVIDGSIAMLESSGADSVVSVCPVPAKFNPHWLYFQHDDGSLVLSTGEQEPIPRRQELPRTYRRSGSVYVTRRDVLMGGSLYGARVLGYVQEPEETVNIDTPRDWRRAERLLRERPA